MKLWYSFRRAVEKNVLSPSTGVKDLSYWRNRLFANILIYLLPISFVALVPGVIMSFLGDIPLLAYFDLITVGLFAAIALIPSLSLTFRKLSLVVLLYVLAIVLLIFLGSFGPGLIYLLAITVFVALIFPFSISVWAVFVNILICILFSLIIEFDLISGPITGIYTIGSWIAVSSNLVLLSTVIVLSINLLFTGLQTTIEKEAMLQQQLREEGQKLEGMLTSMETKNEELEQFAYIASHDLQEPLRTLTSVVDILDRQYKDKLDGNALTYLSFLSESAERMRALIHGLLEYSRIGKERQFETVNCREIVDEIVVDFGALINEKKATINIGSLPVLQAYRLELKLLFQNLISNAMKFHTGSVKPVVTILSEDLGRQFVFSIADNGIGIEDQFRTKIFIIFQRLHTRAKYEGTGIGLAECKKIAELHGGKIWVESTPGKGSTFYFTIPKIK